MSESELPDTRPQVMIAITKVESSRPSAYWAAADFAEAAISAHREAIKEQGWVEVKRPTIDDLRNNAVVQLLLALLDSSGETEENTLALLSKAFSDLGLPIEIEES